jgi:hypothetical protein
LTAADIAEIPARNLCVSREEFVALWTVAERRLDADQDWYSAGVAMTCRWLAGATVRPSSGPWFVARSPATHRPASAYEELIAAECIAAEVLAMRRPEWVVARDGWIDAVVATLNWAWQRTGPRPLPIGDQVTA